MTLILNEWIFIIRYYKNHIKLVCAMSLRHFGCTNLSEIDWLTWVVVENFIHEIKFSTNTTWVGWPSELSIRKFCFICIARFLRTFFQTLIRQILRTIIYVSPFLMGLVLDFESRLTRSGLRIRNTYRGLDFFRLYERKRLRFEVLSNLEILDNSWYLHVTC